jgi:hypothetical protein
VQEEKDAMAAAAGGDAGRMHRRKNCEAEGCEPRVTRAEFIGTEGLASKEKRCEAEGLGRVPKQFRPWAET